MPAFDSFREDAYPIQFEGTLLCRNMAGGVPSDAEKAENWLRSRYGEKTDDALRRMAADVMVERGISLDEAVAVVNTNRHLNGFRRDPELGLYIPGYHLKAAIKEAAAVAAAAGKIQLRGWGLTKKSILGWVSEHIFVVEDKLPLGTFEYDEIARRFPHTWRGASIQLEEVVHEAKIDFTVVTDHNFTEKEWAMIWLTGEEQGLGATRSQGYGRYTVERWEQTRGPKPAKRHAAAPAAAADDGSGEE